MPDNTIPKPASTEGCAFCDALTSDKQYIGRLREYRTSDGHTIPWIDSLSGMRLTRTEDFYCDTGDVFRGGEIRHGESTHNAILNSKNLIAFTVASTGMKRYVLTQTSPKTSIILKLKANQNILTDEIAREIGAVDDLKDIKDILKSLATDLPPERVERLVNKIVRDPKKAQLIKESKGYVCEACERMPFIQKNGKPYAEADHVKPLGGEYGGLDTPTNMRCLCAQCHAVITLGSSDAIKELLKSTKWQS